MKWIVLWFTLNGAPVTGLPEKQFNTQAECEKFANSRVGMVALFNGPVRYECKAFPFIVPKP